MRRDALDTIAACTNHTCTYVCVLNKPGREFIMSRELSACKNLAGTASSEVALGKNGWGADHSRAARTEWPTHSTTIELSRARRPGTSCAAARRAARNSIQSLSVGTQNANSFRVRPRGLLLWEVLSAAPFPQRRTPSLTLLRSLVLSSYFI